MIENNRYKTTETWVYIVIWGTVVLLYLLDTIQEHAITDAPIFEWGIILKMFRILLPFFTLFLINNFILIPRLLLKDKILPYCLIILALFLLIFEAQYLFFHFQVQPRLPHPPRPCKPRHHLLSFPFLLDLGYLLLTIGGNIAIVMIFKWFGYRLEKETLQTVDAENRLSYLKEQINPHFYLNMLNNIHGMIDINPLKAQEMLVDMSKLMRYTLYESSAPFVNLNKEIEFIDNYIRLMRLRYPEDKVEITTRFPHIENPSGYKIPPLLLPVFVENSFKHGISYKKHSYVHIKLEIKGKNIIFECSNSLNVPIHDTPTGKGLPGIGLSNVNQRLKIIYDDNFILKRTIEPDRYNILLQLPLNPDHITHYRNIGNPKSTQICR